MGLSYYSSELCTAKQAFYLDKLVDEKDIPEDMRTAIKAGMKVGNITKKSASMWLDILFKAKNIGGGSTAPKILEVGFYKDNEGIVWTVVKSKSSSNLYAKQVTNHGFAYVEGAVKNLTLSMKMTLDEIRAHGMATGICCNCAAELSDPISIFIGLGTSCGPNLMGKPAYSQARKDAKNDPVVVEALFHIEVREAAQAAEKVSVGA